MNPIIAEIEALEAHYFRPPRSPEERGRWLADYLEDLGDVEPERVRIACRNWRQSTAKKFPTSGELRRLAPVKPGDGPKLEPWRPITDEEYEALSLSEKIRHQRILAHEAEMKAGAQCANKLPVPADMMPERWQFWRGRAQNHADESKRLLKVLLEAKERGRAA